MKVVRAFHPIGQGAFYSERFYMEDQLGTVHNVVYDCGVAWGYKSKMENVVTQAFTQVDTIDYLFISHLDYDHVSLVKTLIGNVRAVNNIVLPLITEEQLVIALAYHKISEHSNMVYFLRRIINHMRGNGGDDFKNGDYNLLFVAGPDDVNLNFGNQGVQIWRSGASKPSQWSQEWIFKPFNVENHSRKVDLLAEFAKLLAKPDFKAEIKNIGELPLHNADELYEKLKETAFVEKVLSNNTLRSLLKKAYEKVPGGTNKNSLLLYSGPVGKDLEYAARECVSYCCHFGGYYNRAGCLFTGDNDADMMRWKNTIFLDIWDCIGTIQLPHHGSVDSFDITNNPIDRSYIMPVSCGSSNSYGHPSGKVLAYLQSEGCCIPIITEMANTIYMQWISNR